MDILDMRYLFSRDLYKSKWRAKTKKQFWVYMW